jgi:hypothetical protein
VVVVVNTDSPEDESSRASLNIKLVLPPAPTMLITPFLVSPSAWHNEVICLSSDNGEIFSYQKRDQTVKKILKYLPSSANINH